MAGIQNATGSDTRGFCAGPTHALIHAAALVKAGIYKHVMVVAGGATAKLGMNAKDHVKKGLPVLEDVVGGFAVLVSENDGVSPVIRTDLVGNHTVATGSAPQAVMGALIAEGIDKGNLKITDIDVFSVEMQNPDITKPAGAGNVPEANYKMIGALAVKRGDLEKKELKNFIAEHGLPGWAPTQGHIPSGVPYIGFMIDDLTTGVKRGDLEKKELKNFIAEHGLPGWAPTQGHIPSGVPYIGFMIDDLTTGDKNRAMIVGKGSLFLGRMTNLFDGVSVVVERNNGVEEEAAGVSKDEIKKIIAETMKKMALDMVQE